MKKIGLVGGLGPASAILYYRETVEACRTEFTMNSGLYDSALEKAGITPILPDAADRKEIGSLIYPNLENGIVIPSHKKRLIELAEKYIKGFGAEALLLGCTELPLAIGDGDVTVPVLDTARLHIRELLRLADC